MTDTPDPTPASPKVKTFVDPTKIAADLAWSPLDLSAGMMTQASMLLHYGRLASEASAQVDQLKMLLETAEAKVYRKLKDEAVTSGAKTTEEGLKREIAVHPVVMQVKRSLNAARQVESTLKTAVEAFRHRKDMLVSQGLLSREEMRGEVAVRARSYEDQTARVEASMARGDEGRAA